MRTESRRRKPKQPHRCGERVETRRRLRRWFESPLGQWLLQAEQVELASILPNLFGYHVVQVGQPTAASLLTSSRIRHRVILDEEPMEPEAEGESVLQGTADAFPLAGDSIDLLVLSHTLEFADEPHQILREIDRVLIPEGHVVILGFNPWSLWGGGRLMAWRSRQPPWCGHYYSQNRLKDWLALLGFDTVLTHGYFFRPPFQHKGVMSRLLFMENMVRRWWPALGGGYVLVARKRVASLTPIRPRWRPRRSLVGGLAKPTVQRNETRGDDCCS